MPGNITAVDDPLGSGPKVYRYAVNDADQPYAGAQPRADLLSKFLMQDGQTYYISTSVMIPANQIPLVTWPNSNWAQVFQTKNTAASTATCALEVALPHADSTEKYFAFTGNKAGNHPPDWWSPAPVDANWHSLIIKVTASSTPTGSVEIWWDGAKQTFKNGSQVLNNLVTMNSTSDWLGTGLPLDIDFYRNSGFIPGTAVIYHGIPKIGTTYASVAPPIATGPSHHRSSTASRAVLAPPASAASAAGWRRRVPCARAFGECRLFGLVGGRHPDRRPASATSKHGRREESSCSS